MALQNLPSQTQKRGHFKRALTENTAAPDVRPFFAIGTPLWMYRQLTGSDRRTRFASRFCPRRLSAKLQFFVRRNSG
jgi:hypothetical protein